MVADSITHSYDQLTKPELVIHVYNFQCLYVLGFVCDGDLFTKTLLNSEIYTFLFRLKLNYVGN